MKAELLRVYGDDLDVVNAARVSFDKESEWEDGQLSIKDQKLISYLAKHNHFTPFTHVNIRMRETVPIFVARQRFKHMVGFTYNEVSRRYVDTPPEIFYPKEWRKAAENRKQGSSDEVVVNWSDDEMPFHRIADSYELLMSDCLTLYQKMIEEGLAPEQARMVLPQSMYTSYYVTGSLAAWARAYKLRIDPHAQKEIQDLAKQWGDIFDSIPSLQYSWKALTQ